MSQRLYSLVTRSAALLILALLLAPVWDSWRYRGLAASGGATFPVGAIMSAPRHAPDVTAPVVIAALGRPFTGGESARSGSMAGLHSPAPAWTLPPEGMRHTSPGSPGSAFQAWTARAQVDPFWNGDTASPSPVGLPPAGAPVDEASAGALNRAGDPPADSRDSSAAAGVPTPARLDQKRGAPAEGDEPHDNDSSQAPAAADHAQLPGQAGVLAGMWPASPTGPESEPVVPPSPVDSGPASPARAYSPHPSSGDPDPTPVQTPLVTAQVTTPEVAVGDMFVVSIQIDNAEKMTSLPFHLEFDPAVIEFAGSQAGPALSSHDPVLLASVSPNRPGDLAVGLSLIESAGAFTGTGDVVTLQFRALEPGHSDLSFSRASLRGARSEPVEVRFASGSVTVR